MVVVEVRRWGGGRAGDVGVAGDVEPVRQVGGVIVAGPGTALGVGAHGADEGAGRERVAQGDVVDVGGHLGLDDRVGQDVVVAARTPHRPSTRRREDEDAEQRCEPVRSPHWRAGPFCRGGDAEGEPVGVEAEDGAHGGRRSSGAAVPVVPMNARSATRPPHSPLPSREVTSMLVRSPMAGQCFSTTRVVDRRCPRGVRRVGHRVVGVGLRDEVGHRPGRGEPAVAGGELSERGPSVEEQAPPGPWPGSRSSRPGARRRRRRRPGTGWCHRGRSGLPRGVSARTPRRCAPRRTGR